MTLAALFVETDGIYSQYGFDVWGIERDARQYDGPHRVVAHPPCERWGRYWSGGPSAKVRRELGDDAGCFKSALASVRKWGGLGTPRGLPRLGRVRAPQAAQVRRLAPHRVRRLDLLRRARSLRTPRPEGDLAVWF